MVSSKPTRSETTQCQCCRHQYNHAIFNRGNQTRPDYQIESIVSMLYTKMHIHKNNPLSDPPPHTEAENSSHSHNFQHHHFQHDLCLPQVDVTKFDGSDPTGWVTQMEHYFSLYDITNDLAKLRYGVLHLDQERWQWRKNSRQGYIAWT